MDAFDDWTDIAQLYRVRAAPCFLVLRNGSLKKKFHGWVAAVDRSQCATDGFWLWMCA